ncbi:MAG: hypothetical protein PHU40_10115 [Sulfurimonas sp.]|nr:hypothetical protein [Sulfurimonas sp.]
MQKINLQKVDASFVETNNIPLKEKLSRLAALLLSNSAYIDKDLHIHCDDEGLSIHTSSDDLRSKKTIEIPNDLMPRVDEYTFEIKNDMLLCSANNTQTNPLQKEIMCLMIDIYNLTSKISFHKASNIFYNLKADREFLELLLLPIQSKKIEKYVKYLDDEQYETLLIESFLGSREFNLEGDESSRYVLLPLLDYLNHKVLGSGFFLSQNSIYVQNAPTKESSELFVSYSYYDALETLLYYGFSDVASPLYFSLPMKIVLKNNIILEIQNAGFRKMENEYIPQTLAHLSEIIPLITKVNTTKVVISKLLIPNIQLPFALRKFLHLVLNELGIENKQETRLIFIKEIEKEMIFYNMAHYKKLEELLESMREDTKITPFAYKQLNTLIKHNLNHLNNYGKWFEE